MPIPTNVVVGLAIEAVNICCAAGCCIYTGKITSPVSAAAACKHRNKILRLSKGFKGLTLEHLMDKSLIYAYIGGKRKKRDFKNYGFVV